MPKPEDTPTGFTYFRSGAEREASASEGQGPGQGHGQEKAQSQEVVEGDDYPDDGTIPDVKDWIDEDLGRARAALDREQDRPGGPRVTLVDYLNDLLEDETDDTGDDDA